MKQKKLIIHPSTSLLFRLFYSPKPRSQVRILIYRKWSIHEVQNCPRTFRVQGITTRSNQKKLLDERIVRYTGQISTDIRFRPLLYNIYNFI